MSNNRDNIIKLIICTSLIAGVIIAKAISSKDEGKDINSKDQIDQIESVAGDEEKIEGQEEDVEIDDEEDIESNLELEENDIESIMKENRENYDENATDGSESGVYFTNGEILYENEEIPLAVYANQMDAIDSFVDLNFEGVTGITIIEESVSIEAGYLKYNCDLNNDHILYVTCDLSTYSFSFSESPKFEK